MSDQAGPSTSRVNASDLNGPVSNDDGWDSYRPGPSQDRYYSDDRQPRRERRPSPSYDYEERQRRRLTPERELEGRGRENGRGGGGYPGGPPRHGGPPGGGGRGGGGGGGYGRGGVSAEFLAERRAQRDASNISIWPPSPRAAHDDVVDSEEERSRKKRKKDKHSSKSSKHRKSKRRSHSDDESDLSGTESDDDDGKRKSSKKKRKSKHRSSRKYSDESDSESDSEYERRKRRKDKKKKSSSSRRSRSRSAISRSPDRVHNEQEDEWAEKLPNGSSAPAVGEPKLAVTAAPADKTGSTSAVGKGKEVVDDDDDDDDVGPKPLQEAVDKADPRAFGGALLKGEGQAMAAFVSEGQRIPRRGEIGLESEQIEKYEAAGFVMSGSRHRRMNAVRMRKENQVISAEEKRGILKLQKEEQEKKEALIVGSFKELVEKRLESERRKR